MILKTRALNSILLFLLISFRAGAEGFNTFECLREMMPLTEHGSFQRKRTDVEKPFISDGKYLVFPEVLARKLTGFFVYDHDGAYYYDTIEVKSEGSPKDLPIAMLALAKERPLYQMVAQPGGLETMTIYYMPGYKAGGSNGNGPVILGTSVLPVVGAFLSRPEQYDYVYQSPQDVADNRLQEWLAKNKGGRTPAAVTEQKIDRQIVTLSTQRKKDEKVIWKPLKEELRMRRFWVKDHNLDNQTFKKISHLMDGPCKD